MSQIPPQETTPDSATLAIALREAIGGFVRTIRSQTGTTTTAQSEVLAYLERHGSASVAVLADARGVKHQSMRLVVARLAGMGLLDLQPDPNDRRSQLVRLTGAGRDEVTAGRYARSTHLAHLLDFKLNKSEMILLSEAIRLLNRLSADD